MALRRGTENSALCIYDILHSIYTCCVQLGTGKLVSAAIRYLVSPRFHYSPVQVHSALFPELGVAVSYIKPEHLIGRPAAWMDGCDSFASISYLSKHT